MPSKIRMPLNIKSGIIPVKVLFIGKADEKVLDMVLDTGASITTIPFETAFLIGCDPTQPIRKIEVVTASGVEYAPVVEIPEINLFGFKLKDIEATCLDLPPRSRVSGLLGLDILSNFDIFLAFRKRFLELSK